jgi:hypothetical protein
MEIALNQLHLVPERCGLTFKGSNIQLTAVTADVTAEANQNWCAARRIGLQSDHRA